MSEIIYTKPFIGQANKADTTVKPVAKTNDIVAKPELFNDKGKAVLDYANSTYNQIPAQKKSLYIAEISKNLDAQGKIILLNLMKSGKLYSTDSNDGSSTLENLYKIAKEPRIEFFNTQNILKETLLTLADPYRITQNFGTIPEKMAPPGFINFSKGHTCSAASIEFDLADRKPAEFVRYIEGFTSPAKRVKTKIEYTDLLPNMTQAVNTLVEQNTEFKGADWKTAEVTIRPDKNAYLRADVQEDYKQPNTRSMIDVLMQSAFMELGSRGTYDDLTDERSSETGDGRGLNQFEIAFVESIVDGKSKKVPVVYMELDDQATKILKYAYPPETTKKHLLEAMDKGYNIITGFLVNMDDKGNIVTPDGHEVMLTGYRYNDKGKLEFKYQDSDDDDNFKPSWIKADGFIHSIHHANVPESVLGKDVLKNLQA